MNNLVLFFITLIYVSTYSYAYQDSCITSNENTPLNSSLITLCQEIEQLSQQDKLNAVVIIAKGDNILCTNISGPANETDVLNISSQFYIGSNTKTFTAVALLKSLHDQFNEKTENSNLDKITAALQKTLDQYLPKSHKIWNGQMPEWAKQVTLHQLLNHTSGIKNYTAASLFTKKINDNQFYYEAAHTPTEILEIVKNDPLLFNPGESEMYSNTGYVLLAEAIESISGMSYEEYLRESIFDPLGMKNTFSVKSGTHDELKQDSRFHYLANDYKYDPRDLAKDIYRPSTHIDMSNTKGTGSIISTAPDLLKWIQGLTSGRVLPNDLYNLLLEKDYGIGNDPLSVGQIYGHKGRLDSFNSTVFFIPNLDAIIIVLSNLEYDWDLFKSDYQEIKSSLKEEEHSSLSEEELNEHIKNKIFEKYPDCRGCGPLDELILKKLEAL